VKNLAMMAGFNAI